MSLKAAHGRIRLLRAIHADLPPFRHVGSDPNSVDWDRHPSQREVPLADIAMGRVTHTSRHSTIKHAAAQLNSPEPFLPA